MILPGKEARHPPAAASRKKPKAHALFNPIFMFIVKCPEIKTRPL
jgi:hypothetical protein